MEYDIDRETVRKMLRYSAPPGYRREQAVNRPKLEPWLGVVDAILKDGQYQPKKNNGTPPSGYTTACGKSRATPV